MAHDSKFIRDRGAVAPEMILTYAFSESAAGGTRIAIRVAKVRI
jgi:hypothetical protein